MRNSPVLTAHPSGKKRAEEVPIIFGGDEALLRLSQSRLLALALKEMRAIQNYFRAEGREPTDVELETIAQTWSEHCKHKTFRGVIEFRWQRPDGKWQMKIYDDLLKQTIFKATKELEKSFCFSFFEDNAGIIQFDRNWAVAFKVETHNHPSALEPYGGAGTGIGGVIRDILGAGLGAKPVLNTDVFCVGEFSSDASIKDDLELLPPRRILSGVVAGVRDYGNRMGIPTGNGAVLFHEGYRANPLVFCGTVGVLPGDKVHKQVQPCDLIVSIGGKTGRDGIHGATFSSRSLEKELSGSLVQIGNAIVEKKVAEALLLARDKNLYHAITDCGAGGYSSAVGELASKCGAKIHLEKVPLKYAGLLPWEIWLSESQERMVLAVSREKLKEFQQICEIEEVECTVLGEFSEDQRLTVYDGNEKVCDLEMDFLHHGLPRVRKKSFWMPPHSAPLARRERMKVRVKKDFEKILKKLISHPNISSKKRIVQQYDHEVQGGSVIKPFVGSDSDGPSDACVFRPLLDSWKGLVVSNGINPLYGEIDPYWMAANAIDECLRNLVAVGGNIDHCAILDNFCWGDVENQEVLGGLVRCAEGCYDFAKRFGVPFISGKDSLNNTWRTPEGKVLSIPGTLLISAISVVKDVRKCVTMDFKRSGNWIALLGETENEFGGSHFNKVHALSGGEVPKVNARRSKKMMRSLFKAIQAGCVRSCHDLSEGGLAVALTEMCLGGNLGAAVDLSHSSNNSEMVLLFSESASRWLIEIEPENISKAKNYFSSLPFALIGKVHQRSTLKVRGKKEIFESSLLELKTLWHSFSDHPWP